MLFALCSDTGTYQPDRRARAGSTVPPAAIDPRDAADRRPSLVEPDFTTVNLPTTLRLPQVQKLVPDHPPFRADSERPEFREAGRRSVRPGQRRADRPRIPVRVDARASSGHLPQQHQDDSVLRPVRRDEAERVRPFYGEPVRRIEGLNNFHRGDVVDEEDNAYATAISGILSRTIGSRGALYLQPAYIIHSNTYSTAGCFEHIEHGHDIPGCVDATTTGIESDTLLVGLSGRMRMTQGVYVVGSWTPRASGFRPGVSIKTFGIEKRLRGHVFQLNVSNSLGTTMAEMARGATNNRDWFLGFNMSRKFYLASCPDLPDSLFAPAGRGSLRPD